MQVKRFAIKGLRPTKISEEHDSVLCYHIEVTPQETSVMTSFQQRALSLSLFFACVGMLSARDTENYNGHDVAAKQAIVQLDLVRVGGRLSAVLQQLGAAGNADELRPLNLSLGMYLVHSNVNNVPA